MDDCLVQTKQRFGYCLPNLEYLYSFEFSINFYISKCRRSTVEKKLILSWEVDDSNPCSGMYQSINWLYFLSYLQLWMFNNNIFHLTVTGNIVTRPTYISKKVYKPGKHVKSQARAIVGDKGHSLNFLFRRNRSPVMWSTIV